MKCDRPIVLLIGSIVLLFAITSCREKTNNPVTIEIQVEPGIYDSLGYYLSQNQIVAYPFWNFQRAYFDSTGYVKLTLDNDNINCFFITFFKEDLGSSYEEIMFKRNSRVFMLLQPGESYKISYNPDSSSLFTFDGHFKEGQQFYNNFQLLQPEPYNRNITDPGLLFTDLEDTINNSLDPLKELYKEKKIDKTFFTATKTQVEYYFALIFLNGLKNRYSYFKRSELKPPDKVIPINVLQEKYYKLIAAIFKMFPYDSKNAPLFFDYGNYLESYIWYKTLNDTSFSHRVDKLKKVEFAENYFNDELLEYFFVHQFQSFSLNEGSEIEEMRYKTFLEHYPNSLYKPGIERNISFSKQFFSEMYPASDRDKIYIENSNTFGRFIMPPDVNVIEGENDSLSLDALLKKFLGKNIFIDFWASWCLPCRSEFAFADTLYNFLQNINYEMLYISSDKEEDKWLETIQLFKLKGHHYRITTPELRKEIYKLAPAIPRYIIVNSEGEIVEYEANRPSSGELLYKQLLQYVK